MIYENEAVKTSRDQKRRIKRRTKIGNKNNAPTTKNKSRFVTAGRTILLVKNNRDFI
jgi:hypothetical protein